ncbi:MAG: DUF4390 domain-containing protein [Deltaproteobacteria bacterium]|nr:DUF4390 domain-containing protein [Deltaproteobacteria bacterium]
MSFEAPFQWSVGSVRNILTCLATALFIFYPAVSFCEDARIDEVVVSAPPALKVSFKVKDAFTPDIEEAVRSGIPTSFNFIIELDRVRPLFFNETAGTWVFRHTVKYDSLKDEYEVSLDEADGGAVRTKDFREMQRLMTTCSSIPLIPGSLLSRGGGYELRIMAQLRTAELPFMLDYVLFFIRFRDFKTDWYTYRFTL